ncbi:PREDICTED: probable E3 ubiquitin-protein ligase RNF217 [Erythranthe guttata]|nr:PREDICTED: probable E3 ubiquitin-protein ligase RNF217 [Erythranthe guttata]|eukprot:XP_012852686.1 PREDICTED: probable E3 ubiquitin-protein ligase RNF217 [Erythranthe guttata]
MNDGGGDVREAECPFCNRLFCARCSVTWHSGVDCEEFSKLRFDERGREDRMVHELAKKNQWQRCPRCKFFVERKEGCLHITCRCGFQFCYACGAAWSSTHGGCR